MWVCDLESVTRTSAGSRNMAEMRMRKEKIDDISTTDHPIHFMFGFRVPGRFFGVGGSNGSISG